MGSCLCAAPVINEELEMQEMEGGQGCCLSFGHKVSRDHRDILVSTASQDQSSAFSPNLSLTWAGDHNASREAEG